jgi:hypothetical protein
MTREKWTGGVAQVEGCLLCKHEAMIPNPSPTTKKKRKIAERKFHNVNSD